MKTRWFVAAACLLLLGLPSRAHAENDKATAHRWYSEGKRLYDVGDYVKALEGFKRAYLAYEEPSFLFNMAQCDRALGNKAEAVQTYKSYLRNLPSAPNRVDVERVIKQLEAQLADERQAAATAAAHASEPPPPVATPAPIVAPPAPATETLTASAPAPAPKKRHTWWIWPVAGVVVAGAAVGIALGLTLGRPNEATLNKVQF